MDKKPFKSCFVQSCLSSTTKTPDKIFLHVPERPDLRQMWCNAVGRPNEKTPKTSYCCEDHFILEQDVQNYYAFSVIGGRKRIKKGVVPHLMLSATNEGDCDLNSNAEYTLQVESLRDPWSSENPSSEFPIKQELESIYSLEFKEEKLDSTENISQTDNLNEIQKVLTDSVIMKNESLSGGVEIVQHHIQNHAHLQNNQTIKFNKLNQRGKTSTERVREYRRRKKMALQNLMKNLNEIQKVSIDSVIMKNEPLNGDSEKVEHNVQNNAHEPHRETFESNKSQPRAKTSTERVREYRRRKKMFWQHLAENLNEIRKISNDSIIIKNESLNGDLNITQNYAQIPTYELHNQTVESKKLKPRSKTSAERVREYRRRKKLALQNLTKNLIKIQETNDYAMKDESLCTGIEIAQNNVHSQNTKARGKTSTERVREYRRRKKILWQHLTKNLNEIQKVSDDSDNMKNEPLSGVKVTHNHVQIHKHESYSSTIESKKSKPRGKTSAERVREYRRRKKLLALQDLAETTSTSVPFEFLNVDIKREPICKEDPLTYEDIPDEILLQEDIDALKKNMFHFGKKMVP